MTPSSFQHHSVVPFGDDKGIEVMQDLILPSQQRPDLLWRDVRS
jgi:hypothetical protein